MSDRECFNNLPEWLDLRTLKWHACISVRTLRTWIHRPVDPLPAVCVGKKLLIRRSTFDAWLEAHKLKQIDADIILDQMIASIKAKP